MYGTVLSVPWIRGEGFSALDTTAALKSATVARCIAFKATMIAACPLVLEKRVGRGKWEQVEDDSTEANGLARLLARPNEMQGRTEFWLLHHAGRYALGRDYILTDYMNGGRPVSKGRQFPRELRVLRGDTITPVFSKDPRVLAPIQYVHTAPMGGQVVEYAPDEIVADRIPSYMNPLHGASQLTAAVIYGMLEEVLPRYQHGYFKNGARAGLVFETDAKLKDDELKRIRAQWNEQHSNAAGKMFTTAFLHSGMRLKEQQAGRKEGDFRDLFSLSKEQIGMSFGLFPVFLGDFSNATLANIEEQTPLLIENTLSPESKITQEQLNNLLVPRFDPGIRTNYRVRYAWEETPAMQRHAVKRAQAYVTLTGVPILRPDEARAMEGYEPVPGGNRLYVPFSMQPADEPIEREPAPARPDEEDEGAAKSVRRSKWIDDPERHAKRRRAASSMKRFERGALREIRAFLSNQEDRVLAALGDGTKTVKGVVLKITADDLFDEQFESEIAREVLVRIYARVISTRGPEALELVGLPRDSFLMDHRDVLAYLERHAYENGTLITGTTAEALRDAITEAVQAGESIQEMTRAIRDVFAVRRHEAQRIARTEVASSYNFATFTAWGQTGLVEETEWLTAQDDAVRETHQALDGKRAALGEQFENGLLYPGDPGGDPSEVINCRCTALPVVKREGGGERGARVGASLAAMFPEKKR